MNIERGQVYFVELDPVVGREIGGNKRRPVAVLSINDLNRKPLVVTVVPGTKASGKPAHHRNSVLIDPTAENGLTMATIFQCHQVRALDQSRFTSPPVGRLSAAEMKRIEKAVKYSLGLLETDLPGR